MRTLTFLISYFCILTSALCIPYNVLSHANFCAGRRTAYLSQEGLRGDYSRVGTSRQAGEVARLGQALACEAGNGSDRSRLASGTHRGVAQAQTFSGSWAHRHFSDWRFHWHDRRSDGTLGDEATAQPRTD